jgi:hypothetical protein
MLVLLLLLPLSLAMDRASLTTVMAVEAVAARRQWQQRRWRRLTTIGGKSGRQQERRQLHDGVR